MVHIATARLFEPSQYKKSFGNHNHFLKSNLLLSFACIIGKLAIDAKMEGLAPAESQSSNSSSSDLAIDVSKTMESEKSLQEPERVVTSEDQISPVDIDLEKQSTHHDPEEHQSAARVVTAQDWTGPNDPENPFNWSINKKSYHILVAGLFALSV